MNLGQQHRKMEKTPPKNVTSDESLFGDGSKKSWNEFFSASEAGT